MSVTFAKIQAAVLTEDWRVSAHALQRLTKRDILGSELADTIGAGEVIEDYPTYHAGPSVLVLQHDHRGPVHVLWGLATGTDAPAVIVTAYRPDPQHWLADNRTRRP